MDEDTLNAVWNQTLDEVEAGELSGPYHVEQVPQEYPLSKRFGIKQSSKVRCVDEFTQSSINACAQTCESPKPHTVDILRSMCLALMKVANGKFYLEERSFDLKRAYRQCAIHPDHSFLRISHSLWAILVSIFGVFVSNYFDDFVALATSCETTSVTTAVTLTFKMLGWIFAETGDKHHRLPALLQPWCDD